MNRCFKCKNEIVEPASYGLHEACFVAWFELENTKEFHDLDPKTSSAKSSHPHIEKRADSFFHGRYLKYSARLGSVAYILKVQEPAFPELPMTEYLCNEMAHALDIEVPPFHLINFNGRISFVTRNFMQDHVGTLHHLYKFLPAGAEHYTCEAIIKLLSTETKKLSDTSRFIEICLFDALIGNNDRHGRNLAIIETAHTKKLAPMYDNPCIIGTQDENFLEAHFNPSGSIWTRNSKEPRPADYIEEFKRLGYHKTINAFCQKVNVRQEILKNLIQHSYLSQKRKKAFLNLLENRIGDFRYEK